MVHDRATFDVSRASLIALVGAIATVESFLNPPGAMTSLQNQKQTGNIAMSFASLYARPASHVPLRSSPNRRPTFHSEDDLPPDLREKMLVPAHHDDIMLLRHRLEKKIVDLDPHDFSGKPANEWSLPRHLLDLKSALGQLAIEHKAPGIMVNSDKVRELPEFKMLEQAYLHVCRNEPESKRRTHFLTEQLLLEVQGLKPNTLVSDYAAHYDAGSQHDFILEALSQRNQLDVRHPGP